MSSPVSFLAVVHCLRTLSLVAVDLIQLVTLAARPRAALVPRTCFCESSWLCSRSEGQAPTSRCFHPLDDGGSESMVRLARRAGECPSGHPPALAPPRISPLLALEVEDGEPTAPAQQPPSVDPRDGRRQSHLGDRNASPTSCN